MPYARDTGPKGLMKWFALRTPIPWMRNLPTGAGVDPHREGTQPSTLEADRARAIRLLHQLAASSATPPHPVFGPMSVADWRRWGYLHTDHHLRQFGV